MVRYAYNHSSYREWLNAVRDEPSKLEGLDDYDLIGAIICGLRFDDELTLEEIAHALDRPIEDIYLYAEKLAALGILKELK